MDSFFLASYHHESYNPLRALLNRIYRSERRSSNDLASSSEEEEAADAGRLPIPHCTRIGRL